MKTTTAERTVAAMRTVFARLGLPVQLVSDNGPQFACDELTTFAAANGTRHTRVAPYHPASNGPAERACGHGDRHPRRTGAGPVPHGVPLHVPVPHAVTGRTPAEMMYGRNLRTRLNLLMDLCQWPLFVLRQTFRGVQFVWERYVEAGCQFLCTRRLNQDPLENIFDVIRRSGGSMNN